MALTSTCRAARGPRGERPLVSRVRELRTHGLTGDPARARYTDLAEVIAWHRASPYGQQVGIHGPASPARRALVDALAPFTARINLDDVCQRGPDTFGFTAADKSGFGTLSIEAALRSFTRTVIVQSPDPAAI